MKPRFFLLAVNLLTALVFSAQTQTMVVKTNGDTVYCDKITAGGKKIICETGGQKTKLLASEVSYYIEPYKYVLSDGDPPPTKDTTRKCFVSANGKIHEVILENDKYYLTYSTSKKENHQFDVHENYHIMDKKNAEVALIVQNKTAPDTLAKYFGGTCPEFDAKVKAAKPKFNNKIFPILLWGELLDFYITGCKK